MYRLKMLKGRDSQRFSKIPSDSRKIPQRFFKETTKIIENLYESHSHLKESHANLLQNPSGILQYPLVLNSNRKKSSFKVKRTTPTNKLFHFSTKNKPIK